MQLGHASDTVDGGIGPVFTLGPILCTCCRRLEILTALTLNRFSKSLGVQWLLHSLSFPMQQRNLHPGGWSGQSQGMHRLLDRKSFLPASPTRREEGGPASTISELVRG